MMQAQQQQAQKADLSQRKLAEKTVVAQADTRTNSLVVSAARGIMDQVAEVVEQLDQNPAKAKKVYVYSVKNANPEEVTVMLQGMFSGTNGGTNNTNNPTGQSRVGNIINQTGNSNNNRRNTNSNSALGLGSRSGGSGFGSSR